MTTSLQQTLDRADRAWRDGLLLEAHAQYSEALRRDPASWHAAFQLAWLDAAVGAIDPDRIRPLEERGVAGDGAALLELLRDRAAPDWSDRLPGELRAWDLATLRAAPEAGDAHWWEARAQAAAEALPNVAHACWEEAEALDPGRYHKRPHAMLAVAREAEWHMDTLLAIVQRLSAPGSE